MMIWLLPLLGLIAAGGDEWSQFRGPNGSGVDSASGYPVQFSPTKNVVWKAAIPYGQSSPVVVGRPRLSDRRRTDQAADDLSRRKNGPRIMAPRDPPQKATDDFSRQRSSLAHSSRRRKRRSSLLRRVRSGRLFRRGKRSLDRASRPVQKLLRYGRIADSRGGIVSAGN